MSSLFFLLSILHHFYHWTNSHVCPKCRKSVAKVPHYLLEKTSSIRYASNSDVNTHSSCGHMLSHEATCFESRISQQQRRRKEGRKENQRWKGETQWEDSFSS